MPKYRSWCQGRGKYIRLTEINYCIKDIAVQCFEFGFEKNMSMISNIKVNIINSTHESVFTGLGEYDPTHM